MARGLDEVRTSDPSTLPESEWWRFYDELKGVATAMMRGEPRSPSLEPTLVLHEAYMRVFGRHTPTWRGRAYFIASMARAMRQFLIERGRRRRVERRALPSLVVRDVAELRLADCWNHPDCALELWAAIDDLAKVAPRAAVIVELRCAYDLANGAMAEMLEVSERTVKADWTFARAWLASRLGGSLGNGASGDWRN